MRGRVEGEVDFALLMGRLPFRLASGVVFAMVVGCCCCRWWCLGWRFFFVVGIQYKYFCLLYAVEVCMLFVCFCFFKLFVGMAERFRDGCSLSCVQNHPKLTIIICVL